MKKIVSIVIVFSLLLNNLFISQNTKEVSGEKKTVSEEKSIKIRTRSRHKYRIDEEILQENLKRYVNEDGSYTTYYYDYPVRYKDDKGKMHDIDNSIIPVKSTKIKKKGYAYQNKSNNLKVSFSELLTEEEAINVKYKDYNISFHAKMTKKAKKKANDLSHQKAVIKKSKLSDEEVVSFDNAVSADCLTEYSVINNGIKENMILNSYSGQNEFTFTFDFKGAIPQLINESYVIIHNPLSPEEMIIKPISVFDSSEKKRITQNNKVKLKENNDGTYDYTMIIDRKFLESPDTQYPVVIDPMISINHYYTESSTVYSASPYNNQTFPNQLFHHVGQMGSMGTAMTYMKFSFPFLDIKSIDIVSAWYEFDIVSGEMRDNTITAYRVNDYWDPFTLKYNNRPPNNTAFLGRLQTSNNNPRVDISVAVKSWVDQSSPNYGIVFKYNGGGITMRSPYNAPNYYDPSANGCLVITHNAVNTPGLFNESVYFIKNKKNGRYLTANDAANGERVSAVGFSGESVQQWKIKFDGNGSYYLYSLESGHSLNYIRNSNWYVLNTQASTSATGKWNIRLNANGSYRIVDTSGQRVVSVDDPHINSAAWVEMYEYTPDEITNGDMCDWEFIPAIRNGSSYYIKNKSSGLYLSDKNARASVGVLTSSNAFKWKINSTPRNDGFYFQNAGTNKYLTVANGNSGDNVFIVMENYADPLTTGKQQWRISHSQSSEGHAVIRTAVSGYYSCLMASTLGDYTIQYAVNKARNEEWIIELADPYDKKGKYVELDIEDGFFDGVKPEKVKKFIEKLDVMYMTFTEITGREPINKKVTITRSSVGGAYARYWAGLILWDLAGLKNICEAPDNVWSWVMLHEMGHIFDFEEQRYFYRNREFTEHFANLKVYDFYSRRGGNIDNAAFTTLASMEQYMFNEYTKAREQKITTISDYYTYIFIKIYKGIGKEAYEKAYRYFNLLPSAPPNDYTRFNLFMTKLRDYSGQDVLSIYMDSIDKQMIAENLSTSISNIKYVS